MVDHVNHCFDQFLESVYVWSLGISRGWGASTQDSDQDMFQLGCLRSFWFYVIGLKCANSESSGAPAKNLCCWVLRADDSWHQLQTILGHKYIFKHISDCNTASYLCVSLSTSTKVNDDIDLCWTFLDCNVHCLKFQSRHFVAQITEQIQRLDRLITTLLRCPEEDGPATGSNHDLWKRENSRTPSYSVSQHDNQIQEE